MSSAKKINARIEKWRAMLSVGLHKDKQLLYSRTRKGVPTSMRNVVWIKLVPLQKHIQQRRIDIDYQKLTKTISNNVYEIGLDIPRTFPEQEDSKALSKSMNDVLKAIAIVYPKIGYCQGMNFLTIRILQILDNQQTFWLLHYLFQNDRYLSNNFINPSSVLLHDFIFDSLLSNQLPKIHKLIINKGIHINSFTMKSFMTLYSGCLKQQPFNRIFQVYLLQGWSIIYATALAMFRLHQKQFQTITSSEGLQTLITKKVFIVQDCDELMQEASKFKISEQQIKKYERIYYKQNKNLHLLRNSEIRERINNNQKTDNLMPQFQNIKEVLLSARPKFDGQFQIMQVLKHKIN